MEYFFKKEANSGKTIDSLLSPVLFKASKNGLEKQGVSLKFDGDTKFINVKIPT